MQVVTLHQPDAETIGLLRELLRQAEAGELQSLIYSAERAGGDIENGYTDLRNGYEVIGQLERMKYLIFQNLDEMMHG